MYNIIFNIINNTKYNYISVTHSKIQRTTSAFETYIPI